MGPTNSDEHLLLYCRLGVVPPVRPPNYIPLKAKADMLASLAFVHLTLITTLSSAGLSAFRSLGPDRPATGPLEEGSISQEQNDLDSLPNREVVQVLDTGDSWTLTVVEHPELGQVRHGEAELRSRAGELLQRGDFQSGVRDGHWSFFWPSGEPMAKGRFVDGLMSGRWSTFYPDKRDGRRGVFAEGRYIDGFRQGEWKCYSLSGEASKRLYEPWIDRYPNGSIKVAGQVCDGHVTGLWEAWWPNGRLAVRGMLDRGVFVGPVEVRHQDGTYDVDLVLGRTDFHSLELQIQWVLDDFRRVPAPAGAALPINGQAEPESFKSDLKELRLSFPVVSPAHHVLDRTEALLNSAESSEASLELLDLGRTDEWVNSAAWLSVEGDDEAPARVLDSEALERLARRLATLALLGSFDPLLSIWLPMMEEARLACHVNGNPSGGHSFYIAAPPSQREPAREKSFDRDVRVAIDRSLGWLVRTQQEDGSWGVEDDFESSAALGIAPGFEAGFGNPAHEIGVTGLAICAFLDAGHGLFSERYGECLGRAFSLLARAQRADGRIGVQASSDWIYDHAIATLAIARLAQDCPHPALTGILADAMTFLEGQRGPHTLRKWVWDAERQVGDWVEVGRLVSGWGYGLHDAPDSSVTAWCFRAMAEGSAALGRELPREICEGVLKHYDSVTSGEGVVGYSRLGEGSARLYHLLEKFPSSLVQPLTAGALLARRVSADRLGRDQVPDDLVELGVQRVLDALPAWTDDGGATDAYYWYWGCLGLRAWGDDHPEAWKVWRKLLLEVILERQVLSKTPADGTWPQNTVWSEVGGAVYLTALCCSMLAMLGDE
jgi:antitoxin component YwqK of YwqJK toxin-antitoxin module